MAGYTNRFWTSYLVNQQLIKYTEPGKNPLSNRPRSSLQTTMSYVCLEENIVSVGTCLNYRPIL